MTEERVAVLETRLRRSEKDVGQLFAFFREHMEKEEEMNAEFLALIAEINQKLSSQKSFWSGMVFAFTGVGALVGGLIGYYRGGS